MTGNENSEVNKLELANALTSQHTSINVRNTESDIIRCLHMNVPFQVTLEYCSGPEPDDYVNIVTLSADKTVLYQESVDLKNHTPQHFHDFFEFLIVLEGTVIQKIEGKDYIYDSGSCCLINRSLCHLECYNSSTKMLFIGLSPAFIQELFTSTQGSCFYEEQTICDSEIYRFIADDLKNPGEKACLNFIPTGGSHHHAERLHTLAESMIHTLLFPDFGAAYKIRGLFCSFLAYLSSPQNYICTNIQFNTGSDFLVFSRVSLLLEESDGRISRSELEQRLNYSGDYLNRIVNKYAGMCLFDYGMTFCMKKAAMYLTESNESIGAIAAKLQFSNRTHFYNLFKRKYGMTPKEYRKIH